MHSGLRQGEGGRLGAVVVCGGRSRRMGASKAALPFRGTPMLRWVLDALAATRPRAVVAASGQVLPTLPDDVERLDDERPDAGPLAALRQGLAALEGRADLAFVCATDMPLLVPALAPSLAAHVGDADAAVVVDGDRLQPLIAVYRPRVHRTAAALLESGKRAARALAGAIDTRRVTAQDLLGDPALRRADPTLASLRSANTPEELEALGRALRASSDPGRS